MVKPRPQQGGVARIPNSGEVSQVPGNLNSSLKWGLGGGALGERASKVPIGWGGGARFFSGSLGQSLSPMRVSHSPRCVSRIGSEQLGFFF